MPENDAVNILLVDDRPEGLLALEAVLGRPDYRLVKANSGVEALKQLLTQDFAVILLDVQMPDMDGFETAAIIKQRERSQEIPIIFITAINKEDQYVYRGYEVGAVDYIFKPFDPAIVKSKVAVFVDLFRKREQIKRQAALLREVERKERERQLAELELESLRRYRNLADAIPHMVWKAQADGTMDYFNGVWTECTGLSTEQSVGQGWRSAFHPDDLKKFLKLWRDAILKRKYFEAECRVRRAADGAYRWCLIRVVPELLGNGEIAGWIGTNSDIHDRREAELERARLLVAEQEARASAEEMALRFGQLATVLPHFVWEHDTGGKRTWINNRWFEYTGQNREEAVGVGWVNYVHPEDRERVHAAWDKTLQGQAPYEVEYRVRSKEGRYRWFSGRGAPVYDSSGKVRRWVGITTDIQAFRDLDEQRANFLSLASHELKTPLTSIKATMQLQEAAIRRGAPLSPEQLRRILDTGIRSANRLSLLLDDLLDYSRVESGRLAIEPKFCDWGESVREAVSGHQSTIEAEGRLTLKANLAENVRGYWDVGRLRQVTDNLLGNAIKYSPNSGTIEVSLYEENDQAVFSVRDQGIGIALEDQSRIFRPFERAVETKNYGGFGIGLYVSARIVEQHKGRIEVISKKGEGSTFIVRLPKYACAPQQKDLGVATSPDSSKESAAVGQTA